MKLKLNGCSRVYDHDTVEINSTNADVLLPEGVQLSDYRARITSPISSRNSDPVVCRIVIDEEHGPTRMAVFCKDESRLRQLCGNEREFYLSIEIISKDAGVANPPVADLKESPVTEIPPIVIKYLESCSMESLLLVNELVHNRRDVIVSKANQIK